MVHYAQFDMILLYGPSEIHCYNSNRGRQEVLTSTWHSELQGEEVKLGMFPFPSLESAYTGFTSFFILVVVVVVGVFVSKLKTMPHCMRAKPLL